MFNIICKYIGKDEIINLARANKDYYQYIMNEKTIMSKYSFKVKQDRNLDFIFELPYKIFNINLEYCNINDEDMKYLEGIEQINITRCRNITDKGFKYLKNVKKLNISCCSNITDDYVDYLTSLEVLNVNACRLTDNAFEKLINLQKLDISNTLLTDKCLSNLKKLEKLVM